MFKFSKVKISGMIYIMILFSFLCPTVTWALDQMDQSVSSTLENSDKTLSGEVNTRIGYRRDALKFNIAGDLSGNNPNILSELTWKNIQSVQFQSQGQLVFLNHLVLDAKIGYGRIFSGDNQDSDYLGDDRTFEFSRSNNSADKGDLQDYSGGVGFSLNLEQIAGVDKLNIIPLVGFSYHAQNLRMQDGFQTMDPYGFIGSTGPFAGLNSSYDARWYGLWLGGEIKSRKDALSDFIRLEYHLMKYHAEANWNLRSDFAHPKSFEHTVNHAYGLVLSAGLGYDLTQNWNVNLTMDYNYFKTKHGLDRTYFSDGTTADTRLNMVKWTSLGVNAGLAYTF